jgi:hypothetical protein
MSLHQSYTRWYFATLPPALVSYLLGWPTWVTGGFLAVAALVELVAVAVRKKEGDSLSEHLWVLIDKPAFVPLVLGFCVWLVWTPMALFPASRPITEAVDYDVGLIAFGSGTLTWLLIHIIFRGRYG